MTGATEGTPFDENGEPTEGHYIPNENKSVTSEYEKVRQPGRFQDTHKYFIEKVDQDGNVLEVVEVTEMEYTNASQEGFRGETQFVANKDEKDGFVFRNNCDSTLESPESNQDGVVQGDYVAGIVQEITYNYFKQEVVEIPNLEPEVPEEPETPEPEVPEEPETPEPEVPEGPGTPTPGEPNEPGTPNVPGDGETGGGSSGGGNATGDRSSTTDDPSSSSVLPETGEEQNLNFLSAAAVSFFSGLSLLGYRRKRED